MAFTKPTNFDLLICAGLLIPVGLIVRSMAHTYRDAVAAERAARRTVEQDVRPAMVAICQHNDRCGLPYNSQCVEEQLAFYCEKHDCAAATTSSITNRAGYCRMWGTAASCTSAPEIDCWWFGGPTWP